MKVKFLKHYRDIKRGTVHDMTPRSAEMLIKDGVATLMETKEEKVEVETKEEKEVIETKEKKAPRSNRPNAIKAPK